MTPLGQGLLTGITEVDDPVICEAVAKMLNSAPPREVHQTLLDMATLVTALAGALGERSNTSPKDVLDCVLAR
jgi:hypothetical protein